jgi:hypothetical protein
MEKHDFLEYDNKTADYVLALSMIRGADKDTFRDIENRIGAMNLWDNKNLYEDVKICDLKVGDYFIVKMCYSVEVYRVKEKEKRDLYFWVCEKIYFHRGNKIHDKVNDKYYYYFDIGFDHTNSYEEFQITLNKYKCNRSVIRFTNNVLFRSDQIHESRILTI